MSHRAEVDALNKNVLLLVDTGRVYSLVKVHSSGACSYVAAKIRGSCKGKRDEEGKDEIKGIRERKCILSSGTANGEVGYVEKQPRTQSPPPPYQASDCTRRGGRQ